MNGVPSKYHDSALVDDAVARGEHRDFVGGMWDEIGTLQLEFLIAQGLRPQHRLIDVGCGVLRAAVKLVPYLAPGNYYGIDIAGRLIDVGYAQEVTPLGLAPRLPRANLRTTDTFDVGHFGVSFDYGIAQSVFTHVPRATFDSCLRRLRAYFRPGGVFFSTWFVAPDPSAAHPDWSQGHGIVTHPERDLFHASVPEIVASAAAADGWTPVWIGGWGHPRAQQMLACVRT